MKKKKNGQLSAHKSNGRGKKEHVKIKLYKNCDKMMEQILSHLRINAAVGFVSHYPIQTMSVGCANAKNRMTMANARHCFSAATLNEIRSCSGRHCHWMRASALPHSTWSRMRKPNHFRNGLLFSCSVLFALINKLEERHTNTLAKYKKPNMTIETQRPENKWTTMRK